MRRCNHDGMSVARLKTLVSFGEDTPERASVALELFAVLENGTEHLLLADRGFCWALSSAPASHWTGMMWSDELKDSARACVGPDEPRESQTPSQAEHDHWSVLADDLRIVRGVTTTPAQLAKTPHDVVFDDAITRRLADDA